MNPRFFARVAATTLCTLIVLMSGGLAPYQAAAAELSAAPAAQAPRLAMPASPALPVPGLPQTALGLSAPSLEAAVAGPVSQPAAASAAAAVASAAKAAPASAQVQARASAVSTTLRGYGDLRHGSADSAARAGREIDDILTDRREAEGLGGAAAAVSGDFGLSFAKPAGAEIRDAAEAYHHEAAEAPQPPAPPKTPAGGSNGGDGNGPKGAPLLSKIISSAIALAPAAALAWPLYTGGATLVAVLVAAASVSLAASPFMSLSTPRWTRSLPGLSIAIGGALLTVFGIAISPAALHPSALVIPGLVAALGGWGLVRFGRNDSKWKSPEPSELVAAYIGALGAVTAVGLGFSFLVGPFATTGMVAASVASLALLTQLPGWVGSAIKRAVYGVYLSVEQAYRVSTSVRRDTTLYKRLTALTEAYVRKSVWSLWWLGPLVWLPLVVVEAASTVVAVAFGLVHGLVRAPIMAAWGASYSLWPKSRLTQTLGYMGRGLFSYDKARFFNPIEKIFIPWADSPSLGKSLAAGLAIRITQLLWMMTVAAALPAHSLIEWPHAVIASRKPHDPSLDDPELIRAAEDKLPYQVPGVELPKATGNAALARVLAATIGIVPLVLLAKPLIMGSSGIFPFAIAGASVLIALMPLIPAKHGGAASLAGMLLAGIGLISAGEAAYYLAFGLPVGHIVGMGVAALFGGIGLRHLVSKLRKEDGSKVYDTDSPLYALGFVAALAVSAGLDAALLGKGGLLANSLFAVGGLGGLTLSFFLPKYLWQGLGEVASGAGYSIKSIYKALSFWHDGTDFSHNLTRYLNRILRRWLVAGGWVVVPYLLLGAARFAEAAVSLGAGLAAALYQAPARYLWGAAYHANPNSRFTRFMAGFNKSLTRGTEGNGRGFGRKVAGQFGRWLGETAPSGRPTLKAFAAMIPAGLLAAVFLFFLGTALSPLWYLASTLGWVPGHFATLTSWALAAIFGGSALISGIVSGVRNARGPKANVPSYQDQDNPDFTWNNREAK